MYKSFKRTVLGAVLLLAVLAIGRVAMSFGFVAASVSQGLSMNGSPTTLAGIITQSTSGFSSLAGTLNPAYRRPVTILDVPAELEARRKARDVQVNRGGPLILRIED